MNELYAVIIAGLIELLAVWLHNFIENHPTIYNTLRYYGKFTTCCGVGFDRKKAKYSYDTLTCRQCKRKYIEVDGRMLVKFKALTIKQTYKEITYTNHRTKVKCIINPILRKIQFFTNKPYVIASVTDHGYFLYYKIMRVLYIKI